MSKAIAARTALHLWALCLWATCLGCGGGAAATTQSYRDVTAGPVPGAPPIASAGGERYGGGRRSFDGMAGGPIEAMSWDSSCRGWIPEAPQIQLDVPASGTLVVAATSDIDTTMVVVFPDGRILCNDDTNGLNPQVTADFGPGRYRIYIGTYSQGASGTYHVEVGPP